MKTILLFTLSLFLTIIIHAQFGAYYPDGKKIKFKFTTINGILDSLHVTETTSYRHKLGEVYFKRLSNKPIFILFNEIDYPTKIKEMIASYKYNSYLYSYSYYYDLKDMKNKGSLTKDYLKEVFNEPDTIGQNEDGTEYLIFEKFNAKIIFFKNISLSVDVLNYKAYKRNGLAISSFNVTGSDYTIGFSITLLNYSNKTIKYAFITVTATNPVDDKVGTKTVQAVGPIKPTENGSYEFNDMIFSNTAKYLSIENIKLQYMDGTIKTISKSEVQNIIINDWEEVGSRTIDD